MSRKGRRGSKRLRIGKSFSRAHSKEGRFGNVARFLSKAHNRGKGKMAISEIEIQRGN